MRCEGKSDLAAGGDFEVVLQRGDEDAGVLAGDAAVKVDVFHDSELIDLEGSVAPAVRDLGSFGVVADETVRRIESDDGGFDGDGLTVLEDGLGEADGEARFAGGVGVVVGDLAEKSVAFTQLDSTVEMDVAVEGGAELIAGVDAVGVQCVRE